MGENRVTRDTFLGKRNTSGRKKDGMQLMKAPKGILEGKSEQIEEATAKQYYSRH